MTFEPFELDETKDELRQFYNAINCDVIDYQTIEIDGHVYDCICDDEGLLKPEPIPTLWTGDNILVGNIIFANVNEEGETVPPVYRRLLSDLRLYPRLEYQDAERIYTRTEKETQAKTVRFLTCRILTFMIRWESSKKILLFGTEG